MFFEVAGFINLGEHDSSSSVVDDFSPASLIHLEDHWRLSTIPLDLRLGERVAISLAFGSSADRSRLRPPARSVRELPLHA